MSYLPPKWPIPSDVKHVTVNGYPMAYQDNGAGTPLVLVHGAFCDYRLWAYQLEAFSRKHRVLNVSLRHYFPEVWDGIGNDFSVGQHAQDLSALIQQMGLGPVHLLGHSRGGLVVLEVAKKAPELIRTLIVADASVRLELPETEENQAALASRSKRATDFRQSVAMGDVEGGMARFINSLSGPGRWENTPLERRKRFLQNALTGLIEEAAPLTTDKDLRKFSFPVLLMVGENSPQAIRLLMAEMSKRGNLKPPVVIPKAAHGMFFDNPSVFNEAVLDFTGRH